MLHFHVHFPPKRGDDENIILAESWTSILHWKNDLGGRFLSQQQRGCSRCLAPAEILKHINSPLEAVGPSEAILDFQRCFSALRGCPAPSGILILCNDLPAPPQGSVHWDSKVLLSQVTQVAPAQLQRHLGYPRDFGFILLCVCFTAHPEQATVSLHPIQNESGAASILCLEF